MLIPINVSKTLYSALTDVRNLRWSLLADKISSESEKFTNLSTPPKLETTVEEIKNAVTQNLDIDFEPHYINYVALYAGRYMSVVLQKPATTVQAEFAKFRMLIDESLRQHNLTVRLMTVTEFHRHQAIVAAAIHLNQMYPGLDYLKDLSSCGLMQPDAIGDKSQLTALLYGGYVTYVVMPDEKSPQIAMTPKGKALYDTLPLLENVDVELTKIFFGIYVPTH